MAEITLNVFNREQTGTQAAKKLRREDKIPGVYYFHGGQNIPFYINRKDLHSIWGHESSLLDVAFDNKNKKKCVIRDIQFDPITGKPIHIDLMGIKMTERITVNIHIHLVGIPAGVKDAGGILQQVTREIEIECLPSDIPEKIEVDVSELNLGDNITLSDIQLENVITLDDPDTIIATVVAPRLTVETEEVEEELEEEEEQAEPEVISQKEEKPE